MKIFYSEHIKDYSSYTFSYAVYALMETREELPRIYDMGFLPYSNDITEAGEIFYLARSLRVNLPEFRDSSENRRVDQKLSELALTLELCEAAKFNFKDSEFRKRCLEHAGSRFTGNAINETRFDYILSRKVLSHVFRFFHEGREIANILCLIENDILHYWFAFFDIRYLGDYPIGKWLMWRVIKWAKENGMYRVYLGTCYGEKALYKVRDFKALSFFDGQEWNHDIKKLKNWCKTDEKLLHADRYKLKE